MEMQTTISGSVTVGGLNVYGGEDVTATFHPAKEDSGLVFLVKDQEVPAKLEYAEYKGRGISLYHKGVRVLLVEHMLSAVYALGIDNLKIELSGNVCPTTDNCAKEYFGALKGLRTTQEEPKKFLRYAKDSETQILADGKPDSLTIRPSKGFVIDYHAYYPHKVVGKQDYMLRFDEETYAKDIADARPPGFLGGSLSKSIFLCLGRLGLHGVNERNYLLITSEGAESYANPERFGVRHDGKEFVRHKVLDVLGTLALLGPFRDTEFRFNMTGHKFDLYALKRALDKNCFEEFYEQYGEVRVSGLSL